SRPSRPGRETSRTRQLGTTARGQSRNACADSKVFGCQPSVWISSSKDSRTETSSSTTNTMGGACGIRPAPWERLGSREGLILYPNISASFINSFRLNRCVQRFKQRCVAERFVQKLNRSLLERPGAGSLIPFGGHEDGWDRLPAKFQFSLKVQAGFAG